MYIDVCACTVQGCLHFVVLGGAVVLNFTFLEREIEKWRNIVGYTGVMGLIKWY